MSNFSGSHHALPLFFVYSHAEAQRAQSSHRELFFPADNDNLGPAEMAEMAEIFPLFRYYSVSSVIDKDNSQSDWRKENMPHGLSAISAIWLPLKRRPLVLREIK